MTTPFAVRNSDLFIRETDERLESMEFALHSDNMDVYLFEYPMNCSILFNYYYILLSLSSFFALFIAKA